MRRHYFLLVLSLLLLGLVATGGRHDPPVEMGAYDLQYPAHFGARFTIPADNPLTKPGVYLGRLLFYEKRLSDNGTLSCGTCHQQQLAFTDGQAFSLGTDGTPTPRSAMSLANLLWTRQFFWDGRAQGLEAQATQPLADPHEMNLAPEAAARRLQSIPLYPPLFKLAFDSDTITADRLLKAIAQFERTLVSGNAPYDRYLRGETMLSPAEKHGHDLFMTHPEPAQNLRGANCGDCHGGYKTFMEFYHNNGLDATPTDAGREKQTGRLVDRGRFRVPTLRNIALTAPYMHDGRFATLEAVLDHYNEHIQANASLSPLIIEGTNEVGGKSLGLTPQEKQDVIAFLRTLTDSTFITDPRFADPFVAKKK